MSRRTRSPASFAAATSGSVAPIFGLCIMVVVAVVGVAVDGSRVRAVFREATSALDAAALAATRALRLEGPTDEEVIQLAQRYFAANLMTIESGEASLIELTVAPDRTTNTVSMTAKLRVFTPIAGVVGHDHMDVSVASTAVFDAKDVELAMMLDVSGSMWGDKIADLKASAIDVVDILLPQATPNGNRIAIAPFSTAVNAGDVAALVSRGENNNGSAQAGHSTTCVTERPGPDGMTDKEPDAGLLNRKSAVCPSTAVVPLTDDVDVLKGALESMQAHGMTAGHLGSAWAWYLLSPNWASVYAAPSTPAPYGDESTRKVALIMTDGMFNSAYESANGDSIEQTRQLCANMKGAGITIYTVGFQVPVEVVPTLQYCATSPAHYFNAENGAELKSTFRFIANKLSGLRISS